MFLPRFVLLLLRHIAIGVSVQQSAVSSSALAYLNKSSAVAEMGDRGHSRHGPIRRGAAVSLSPGRRLKCQWQVHVNGMDQHVEYGQATGKKTLMFVFIYLFVCLFLSVCLCLYRPNSYLLTYLLQLTGAADHMAGASEERQRQLRRRYTV